MVGDAKCCKYLNGSQKSLIYSRTLKCSGFGVAATCLSSSCGLNTKHIPACGWEWCGTLWRSTGSKERGWEEVWPWAVGCFSSRLQPGPGQRWAVSTGWWLFRSLCGTRRRLQPSSLVTECPSHQSHLLPWLSGVSSGCGGTSLQHRGLV